MALCVLLSTIGFCQETPPDAPSATQASQAQPAPESKLAIVTLLQRKSLVFPDLATNSARLSTRQKFQLAANNSVGLATVTLALTAAAWGQAINRPSGYEQGAEGYGKRFGADLARSASTNIFGTFLIASALHEDPRFFLRPNLSFKESVKYAARRVVITRKDDGERTINYAGILGRLFSESLANAYYPDNDRTASQTLTRFGSDLAWNFGGNFLRQYWPHINRKLRILPENGH